jgi:C1A family cysteine protease
MTPNASPPRAIKRYGWIPDLPDQRDFVYAAPSATLKALPKRKDLTRGCPQVYDQGQLGSCTANAIGAAHEFDQRLQDVKSAFTPSRLFIYYNERVTENTVNEDSGAMIRDGIKSIVKQGVCPETLWPYIVPRFTKKPPAPCYREALNHQVVSYRRLVQSLTQMKGCLASGFPFVFGFSVYESFEADAVRRTGKVPMPSTDERMLGGHAVLAVGYDDAGKSFIVRNSWGTTWGKKGYGRMPYAYLAHPDLAADFWTIRLVEVAS